MILCAGEALIDMIPATLADGEPAYLPKVGGASLNSAVALGRLGVDVALCTGLSTDVFGRMIVDHAGASGVSVDLCDFSDRPTGLAIVTKRDGHATYGFYDAGSAMRELQPGDLRTGPVPPSAALFGGISLVPEPCGSVFEALCATLKAAGTLVMFDPNIRPAFVTDDAAYRARIARMFALADVVKISDEDLAWLTGAPADDSAAMDAAARALLDEGPVMVCVTRGAEGVTAWRAAGELHVPASPVAVVDTVGAGDTFSAGMLAGLSRDGLLSREALIAASEPELAKALTLGVRAAAVCVARAGANPPWASELDG